MEWRFGIDSIAHKSALKAGGKTIAVLGSGFNDIYPKSNKGLFYKILEQDGLIISEYPPDMPPLPHNFLKRNRIVAALSNGVVLVEAKENSGSITTANHAIKLKRNLFVVPGAISNFNYKGSNKLLADGAYCVLDYRDILKKYKRFSNINLDNVEDIKNDEEILNIPEEYLDIYGVISSVPKSINQISLELNLSIPVLSSKLTLMEMEGFIKAMPGKCFVKC